MGTNDANQLPLIVIIEGLGGRGGGNVFKLQCIHNWVFIYLSTFNPSKASRIPGCQQLNGCAIRKVTERIHFVFNFHMVAPLFLLLFLALSLFSTSRRFIHTSFSHPRPLFYLSYNNDLRGAPSFPPASMPCHVVLWI